LKKPLLLVLLILFLDQLIKVWIKTHMYLGEEIHVAGDWFIIHFTENNGMAFGMEFGGNYGKLFLSSFRIIAIFFLFYYIFSLAKKKAQPGYLYCIALILAGVVGNIIDSVFYGYIFNDSINQISSLFPQGGGYSGLLHGKVVDMFYFPIIEGHFPSWVPIWGSEEFIFFRPVFNLADSAITVGVILILIFQKRFFEDNNLTVRTVDDGEKAAVEKEAVTS
jgi:signal peptidase II